MRNWYYYCWLSGDHIVEQAVHGIDTMGWVMGDKLPVRCWGVGGRQSRTDPKYGNIWDHFSVVYEYPDNVRGYHHCRHWVNTPNQVKDYILGSKGVADVFGSAITGENKWRVSQWSRKPKKRRHVPDRARRDVRRARAGKPINNGEAAAEQHVAGHHGPQGGLHRPGHHARHGSQLERGPKSPQVRVRPTRHAPHPRAGHDQVFLRRSWPRAVLLRAAQPTLTGCAREGIGYASRAGRGQHPSLARRVRINRDRSHAMRKS